LSSISIKLEGDALSVNTLSQLPLFFFKRFYLKTCFTEFDPRLVGPTMLFLAAKVEECSVPNFVKNLKGVDPAWPYTMDSMLECEFYALHYLNFDLIVFHPYRPLTQYLADGKAPDTLQTAWSIVNDSYRTDLSLMYAPYLIAIAAIYMACNFLSKDYNAWLEKSLNVKLEDSHHRQIVAITKKMLRLYDEYSKMKSMDPPIELMRRLDDIFNRKKAPVRDHSAESLKPPNFKQKAQVKPTNYQYSSIRAAPASHNSRQ